MGVSERFACRVTGQNQAPQRPAPTGTTTAAPHAALRVWLRRYEGPPKARVAARVARCPRRGLQRQPPQAPAALARGRAARAAPATTPTHRRQHSARPAERRPPRRRSGPSTSSSTPPPTHDRARWCPSSTNTPANAPGGLVERSVTADRLIDEVDRLATVGGSPRCCAATTARTGLRGMADWAGERVGRWFLPPGEPGATATSSRSTAVCATDAATSPASGRWPRPESCSPTGSRTTTTADATARSAAKPQRTTLPPAPTDNRRAPTVHQFLGSDDSRHVTAHDENGGCRGMPVGEGHASMRTRSSAGLPSTTETTGGREHAKDRRV
jgi:putative transposase